LAELKTWSYSSATTFEKCPKQYYHLYVVKDFKQDPNTEHFLYGNKVHKACELYVKNAEPLAKEFEMFQPVLDKLISIPGDKYCEYKLGLTKDLQPCGFFDDNVWWRGVIDFLAVNEESGVATLADYKTGKSSQYADTRQLSLMSVAIFKHFPKVQKIRSGLIFLVSKEMLKEDYKPENIDDMFQEWGKITTRMDKAYESGVFNASPNFACRKFCPVQSCAHWGK